LPVKCVLDDQATNQKARRPGVSRLGAIESKPGTLSDAELVEGIVCGSEESFNELYDRYFRRVYGFVYNRFGSRADVEEIVQETFTAVFESIGNFRSRASLLSWIFGIARNTANNHLRCAKVRDERIGQTEPEFVQAMHAMSNCSPEEQLNMKRCADDISVSLESVATWQHEIFVMRHVEGLSIAEICVRTERSSDSVRSSLYRVKNLVVSAVGAGPEDASGLRYDSADRGGIRD